MNERRLKTELLPAVMTTVAGIAALAACLFFADQLLIAKRVARLVGLGVLYLGIALFLWAATRLRAAMGGMVSPHLDGVVTTGPYRFVRHPAYCGLLVALIGAAIATRSIVGLAVALFLFLPASVHRAKCEEQALEAATPDAWQEYVAQTGFFLPKLRRGNMGES